LAKTGAIVSNARLSPSEVSDILRNTAVGLGPPGTDNTFGFGRIDAFAAVQSVIDDSDGGDTPGDVDGDGQIQGDVDDLFVMIDAFFGAHVMGNFDCNGDGDMIVQGEVDDLFCQIDKFFGT
jgi:hypothetical protein